MEPTSSTPASLSHRCRHCDRVQINAANEIRSKSPYPWRKWTYTLPHTIPEVSQAASEECPIFVWLWRQIIVSNTPPEQLMRTQIQLDFDTEETPSDLVAGNCHAADVLVSTELYSWSAARFDVVSHFANPSSHGSIARSIVGDVSATSSLDQIRRRLDYCRQYHPGCNAASEQPDRGHSGMHSLTQQPPRVIPLRFLDVDPSRSETKVSLVHRDTAPHEPYTALSYVWGHDQAVKTTMGTSFRHSSGIEITSLPKTIQDAVTVTRHLGIHRLWVDSLCIVQDDPNELDLEIANMSDYYCNSLVTLAAAASGSCNDGFLKPLKEDWDPPNTLSFELPFHSDETVDGGSVRFLPFRGLTHDVIDTRGWTLQEGLLSTRLASFSDDAISWSCLSSDFGKAKIRQVRSILRRAQVDYHSRLREMTHLMGPHASRIADIQLRSRTPGIEEAYLEAWGQIVLEYSHRSLSNPVDGLLAISGVAAAFSSSVRVETETLTPLNERDGQSEPSHRARGIPAYLAGLWRCAVLPLQLLWRPATPTSRIPQPPAAAPGGVYVAPSWSWAASRAPLKPNPPAYRLWLRHVKFSRFRIHECRLELRNPRAPFGALTSGHMIVTGLTCRTDLLSVVRPDSAVKITLDGGEDSSDEAGFLDTARLKSCNPSAGITLLEIVWYAPNVNPKGFNVMDHARGLVLSRTNDGSHRRIGLCYWEGETVDVDIAGSSPWEMQELTLV